MTPTSSDEMKILRLIDLLNRYACLQIDATLVDRAFDTPLLRPGLSVELSGPGVPLLLRNNAELLHAIQYVAEGILRLEPSETNRLWFDAGMPKPINGAKWSDSRK